MRPSLILATGFAFVLAAGAAIVPAYAAQPNSDGVTVLTAPSAPAAPALPSAPAQPAGPQMEQVHLSDGDVVSAAAGSVIMTEMDPKTGDFTTVVTAPGQ